MADPQEQPKDKKPDKKSTRKKQPVVKTVAVEIVCPSGSHTPVIALTGTNTPPFKPVGPLDILGSDNPVITNLLNRHMLHPGACNVPAGVIPTGSPALDLAQEIIQRYSKGLDMTDLRERVNMLAANSQEKAELLTSVLAEDDNQTLVELRTDERYVYNILRQAYYGGQLSATDSITVHAYLQNLLAKVQRRVEDKSTGLSKNVLEIVDKTNYSQVAVQKDLQKKFENTTPQGREILRKLAFRATRIVTETTTTTKTVQETAEAAQADEHQPPQKEPKQKLKKTRKQGK